MWSAARRHRIGTGYSGSITIHYSPTLTRASNSTSSLAPIRFSMAECFYVLTLQKVKESLQSCCTEFVNCEVCHEKTFLAPCCAGHAFVPPWTQNQSKKKVLEKLTAAAAAHWQNPCLTCTKSNSDVGSINDFTYLEDCVVVRNLYKSAIFVHTLLRRSCSFWEEKYRNRLFECCLMYMPKSSSMFWKHNIYFC